MAPWQHRVGKRQNLIVAVVCVVAVAAIWLATLQRIGFERQQAVEAEMEANSNLAIAFEQQVFRTLRAAEQVAAFVREQYLQQGPRFDLSAWVREGAIRETLFTIISVVNESGDVVDSSLAAAHANYRDRPFFTAQINNPYDTLYINAPIIGRISAKARVPMSLRISYPNGRFGGVVVLAVDPNDFTAFYSQADLGGRGLLELTGLDGVVLGRKVDQHSTYGQPAAELAWYERRAFEPVGSFVDDGSAIDGVARVVSYRSVAQYPLMVTVGTAYDDAIAPVLQRRAVYFAIAAIASVGLLAFAALLMLLRTRQREADKALQASEALYRATFHQAASGIAHIDPNGRIVGTNEKFRQMLGYGDAELRGCNLVELSDADSRETVRRFLDHCLSQPASEFSPEIEKPYRRKDGKLLWVCEALGVVRDSTGKPEFLVAVTQDITARKELEGRLSYDASHDALTGLPNRTTFYDRLNQVLAAARRHGRLAAVLYLDLDGFKQVNDAHGHAVGDLLLQEVAKRLRRSVRVEDLVARFGGDEFGVVLESVVAPSDSRVVGEKLVSALSVPYQIDDLTLTISASVGVAVFPVNGRDAAALVMHADTDMYAVKRKHHEYSGRIPA